MSDEKKLLTHYSSLITHYYFLGVAVAFGLAVAWGEAATEADGEAAGLAEGVVEAPGVAGRIPLINSGFASMSAARLFTILASLMATSSSAAFRIFLR